MKTIAETLGNQNKATQMERAWRQLLELSLKRGFFGTVSVELNIADGAVQSIRRRLDQLER